MRKVRLVLIAQLVDVQTKPLESNSFFRRAVASMKSKMLSNCCGLGVRVVWKNCSILRPLFRSPRSELCRPGSAPPASSSSTRSTPSGRSAARPALLLLLLSLLPITIIITSSGSSSSSSTTTTTINSIIVSGRVYMWMWA